MVHMVIKDYDHLVRQEFVQIILQHTLHQVLFLLKCFYLSAHGRRREVTGIFSWTDYNSMGETKALYTNNSLHINLLI